MFSQHKVVAKIELHANQSCYEVFKSQTLTSTTRNYVSDVSICEQHMTILY